MVTDSFTVQVLEDIPAPEDDITMVTKAITIVAAVEESPKK
jgi:hypothetical protein